jgi:hypothetical protein
MVLPGLAPFFDEFITGSTENIQMKNLKEEINFPIPVIARVNDTGNDAWMLSAGFGALLSQEARKETNTYEDREPGGYYSNEIRFMSHMKKRFTLAKGTSGYRAFPVLYTCSGSEVYGWWFSPSWSRCSYDQVQVFADSYYDESKNQFLLSTFNVSMPTGILSFDHYKINNSKLFNFFAEDHRLFLGGVKTGCYRFKWAYAPQGSGERQYRRLDDTAHQSQVLSLGFSRPFRVLGVVNKIIFNSKHSQIRIPWHRVSRGETIPESISILLSVRKHLNDGLPELVDTCSDSVPTAQNKIQSAFRQYLPITNSQRCSSGYGAKIGGLDVIVSAVNVISRLEYSLYVPSQTFDCSRANLISRSSFEYDFYEASFNDIIFPSVVNFPQGPDSLFYAEASEIPAGNYKLKFRAYGEEVLTDQAVAASRCR